MYLLFKLQRVAVLFVYIKTHFNVLLLMFSSLEIPSRQFRGPLHWYKQAEDLRYRLASAEDHFYWYKQTEDVRYRLPSAEDHFY